MKNIESKINDDHPELGKDQVSTFEADWLCVHTDSKMQIIYQLSYLKKSTREKVVKLKIGSHFSNGMVRALIINIQCLQTIPRLIQAIPGNIIEKYKILALFFFKYRVDQNELMSDF